MSRIVKSKLTTLDYQILNYMKENCVGEKNATFGRIIATHFNISMEWFRKRITNIRKYSGIVIATNPNKGYYIPLMNEWEQGKEYADRKFLSEMESRIRSDRKFVNVIYKEIDRIKNSTDYIEQDQSQMKLTGYENDYYNKFGDKYVKQ